MRHRGQKGMRIGTVRLRITEKEVRDDYLPVMIDVLKSPEELTSGPFLSPRNTRSEIELTVSDIRVTTKTPEMWSLGRLLF